MKGWYPEAFDELIREIDESKNKRVDGSKFIRTYIARTGLIVEEDDDERELLILNEIDDFENWLRDNHSNSVAIGRNYFWSRKSHKSDIKNKKVDDTKTPPEYLSNISILELDLSKFDEGLSLTLKKSSKEAYKENDIENAFKFSKKYYDYLGYVNASDSEKLSSLNSIIQMCVNKNGVSRADTYEYYCAKAEIYTKQYEHAESAEQYRLAIKSLEKETNPKPDIISFLRRNKSKIQEGGRVRNAKEKLKTIYQKCRVQYHNAGMSEKASEIYVKECRHIQKNLSLGPKRFLMWLLWVIANYGESPLRVAIWGTIVIFGFACSYMHYGINPPSGLAEHICLGSSTELNCKEISGEATKPSYWSHLYYSVVTFTTLGYGDFSPKAGVSRALSSGEALLGLILTSLFIGTFIKKYSR